MKKIILLNLFFGLWLWVGCKSGPSPEELQKLAQQKKEQRLRDFQIEKFDPYPKKIYTKVEHYPSSNEMRLDLFLPYIKDIGGGYIGVGTDQNFTLIAKARSEFAWLMDLNPVIMGVNKIHLLFLRKASTYEEFKQLWSRKHKKKSFAIVQKEFSTHKQWKIIQKSFKVAYRTFSGVPNRLNLLERMTRKFQLKSFHNTPQEYTYLRNMVLEGRIQAINGDLKGTITLNEIARSAEKLGIKIGILYTSNAEEYFLFPRNYRDNILRLPTDSKSMMVRTFTTGAKSFGFPDGELFPEIPFHYNLQPLENFKKWMQTPERLNVFSIMRKRTRLAKGLSIQKASPQQAGYKGGGNHQKTP